MTGASTSPGAVRAGLYLRGLLSDHQGPYRRRWAAHALRQAEDDVNYLAVAGVVADFLQDFPNREEDRSASADQVMYRVRRALRGEGLTSELLETFILAFGMEHEAAILRDLWTGNGRDRVVIGTLAEASAAARARVPAYRTKRLYELHEVGPDGLPLRHQTMQTIEALEDGLVLRA